MKRFALATMLLAIMGLNTGCGPAPATDDAAPEVETPAVDPGGAEMSEPEADAETPAE
ncbi:hypothetical protein Pla123a_16910 [Posidoniimonas polymericola]|uniref:Uncharacterized protein n=1 Tax=Posidoniimonas polymericola TaxID=2528002 RepID=A0A5C5YSD3_9BACT|nr:hypothetical protein [Posidoniimonas polymericola]TWT77892.1 hypothetical protein Pla123a_16910 [Posidoniimonas polymericola]